MRHRTDTRFPSHVRVVLPLWTIFLIAGTLAGITVGLSGEVQAQTIRGRVVDATTQEPLPGANVAVLGERDSLLTGGAADAQGKFELSGLSPGAYRLRATFLGYNPSVLTDVVVQPSRPTFVLFELQTSSIAFDEVVVTGGFFEEDPDAPVSVKALGPEEIRRTPGGQNDISRSLLALPGVTSGVDNRNDLLVRGGGPGENGYFVDGIRIPQINHFATQGATGGALGLLNVDFIREATFYTGGFPVRYGDAASSILVIENRPGSPETLAGDFTVGATETALSLDGASGDDFNWTFSARRSYLQFLFEALDLPIRPAYWDFQNRTEWELTGRDRLVFFGIWAIDDFDIVEPDGAEEFENREIASRVLDNDQRSYTTGLSWRRLVRSGFVTTAFSRSYQEFAFADEDEAGNPLLSNDAEEAAWRIRSDGEFRVTDRFTLSAGLGGSRETVQTAFFQRATPATNIDEDLEFFTDLGLWKGFTYAQLSTQAVQDRLQVTVGLRADANDFLDHSAVVSPRLSASYDLTDRWALSLAAGRFTQFPELVSLAIRDDGAFVNQDLAWIDVFQAIAGIAFYPVESLRISLEGYYKGYSDYPVSASDPRISLANLGGDFGFVGAEPLLSVGEGRAYGVELSAQKKLTRRIYALGAYTFGWSEFTGADGIFRPSSWDIRHSLSMSGGIRLGGWEIGTKLLVQSGRPYTPFDLEASAVEYAISRNGVPDYDRLNDERTPAYIRWDVRVDRRFKLKGSVNGVVYLDVQNVLARENVFALTYTEDPAEPDRLREDTNIGLLPTVGFSIEF